MHFNRMRETNTLPELNTMETDIILMMKRLTHGMTLIGKFPVAEEKREVIMVILKEAIQ